MKFNRMGKIGTACLAAVIVLGTAGGLAYAHRAHTLGVSGVVHACYQGPFAWVVSNDDGAMTSIAGWNPIDKGDDGGGTQYDYWGLSSSNDPSALQSPNQLCTRYLKDVGKAKACISSDRNCITVRLYNAYPLYYPTVFFGLQNVECSPGSIDSIQITNTNGNKLTVNVNGISKGQTINAGCTVVGWLGLRVEQPAAQNATYTIKVTITLSQVCQDRRR